MKKAEKKAETTKIESSDGRYYFQYGLGAEFQCFHRNFGGAKGKPTVTLKIVGCRMLEDETELYDVMFDESEENIREYSTQELEMLLEAGNAEETVPGTAQELPIMVWQVKRYFSSMNRTRKFTKEEVENSLKGERDIDPKTKKRKLDKDGNELWIGGDAEYRAVVKKQEQLAFVIAEKIAHGESDLKEITDEYGKVCLRRKEILEKHGIDLRLFLSEECPGCNNTGIQPNGRICFCAYEKSDEIRTFVAIWKMNERLLNEWLTPFYEPSADDAEELKVQDKLEGSENLIGEGEDEDMI